MHVPKGAIYGFVGRNGAGKTTLIRLICGLQEPTAGCFTVYGIKNTDKNIVKSRRRMGAVVETPSIYLDMTAEDNLKEQYRVLGLPSFDGIPELLKLVGLENTGHILDELSRLATHYGIIDAGHMVKEFSAEELEKACRKCMRVTVSNTKSLVRVLDKMGVDYKILSTTQADVFAKLNISQFTLALAKEDCELLEVQEKDESLESYFVSLVGGGSNA